MTGTFKGKQLSFDGIGEQAPKAAPADGLKDDMRAFLGSRPGSKREAYRGAQTQREGGSTDYGRKISLAERAHTIHELLGFYPYSRQETTYALGLLHELGTPFSTIKYLNQTLQRQSKQNVEITDPRETPLALVREFAGFSFDAKLVRTILGDLAARLDGVNPKLSMSALADEIPTDMLIPLYRDHVVSTRVKSTHFDPDNYEDMGSVLDFDYMSAPFRGEFEQSVTDYAGRMTVFGVRNAIRILDLEQSARSGFWDERVSEANRHVAVRPAVQMAGGVFARAYYPTAEPTPQTIANA